MDRTNDIQSVKNDNIPAERILHLKKIYQKCKWYYWLHTETYNRLYKIYIVIHIPMIFVNITAAILNTGESEDGISNTNTRYISAVILLMNPFFTSILNLFKINEKLEYHKLKASCYIILSNEIEEYISFGEEIDTTVRLYKKYLTYCNDNEYTVPERIIKTAENTLNKKYYNNVDDTENTDVNRTVGVSSFMYIYGLITEIKNGNSKKNVEKARSDDDSPTQTIGKVNATKNSKSTMTLDINHIGKQIITKSRAV